MHSAFWGGRTWTYMTTHTTDTDKNQTKQRSNDKRKRRDKKENKGQTVYKHTEDVTKTEKVREMHEEEKHCQQSAKKTNNQILCKFNILGFIC